MQLTAGRPVDLGGVRGRLIKFGAALLAWLLHVLLVLAIALLQLWRMRLYPLRAFRALFSRDHSQPEFHPLAKRCWTNVVANQFTTPRSIQSVRGLEELIGAVKDAEAAGMKLRAIGSGHSFSDVAIADHVLADVSALDRVLELSELALAPGVQAEKLVRVQCGITIRKLNQELAQRGLALHNMGGYDGQTIAGAISTGTHGSGRVLGALCDAVRSVDLVIEGGELLRIEPSQGGSDRAAHEAKFPSGPRLIQDDDLFHSVVVAMGCLGIAYAYVLEVEPAYYLAERRELLEWSVLRERLLSERFEPTQPIPGGPPIRHFEFLVNPYQTGSNGGRNCLITYRWKVEGPVKTEAGRARNLLATVITSIREFDEILALSLNTFPRLAPRVVDSALKGLVDDLYVAESFTVLNLGDANYTPAYASELAFDATTQHDVPEYVRALDRLFELAAEQGAEGRYHNIPVSVRYVQASPHYLAMSYGRPTVFFELPTLARVPGGWDLLRYYERRLLAEFGSGRAHWGQANFILGPDRVSRAYPKFRRWLSVYAQLSRRGTFDNSFTERLGLRSLCRQNGASDARV